MNLAQIRRVQELSQAELADRMGCSQATISRMERGAGVSLSDVAAYLTACGGEQLRLVCEVGARPVEVVFPTEPARAKG